MKNSFSILLAAVFVFSVVSCQQGVLTIDSVNFDAPRVISATFAPGNVTKTTTTDGKTPLWSAGDKVTFSDGTNTQEFTLVTTTPGANQALIKNSGTSFEVTIPGGWASTIYAVYPSTSYVGINGGEIQYSIPAKQDGEFATANICAAKTTGTSIEFKNVTAVVKLGVPDTGIRYYIIQSENIAGTYQVNPGSAPTLVAGAGKGSVAVFTKSEGSYAAVAPVTVPAGAWFYYEDTESTIVGAQQTSQANTFAINKIYDFGAVTCNDLVPDALAKYAFSVSDTKKVHFTKSNLYWDGSALHFESSPTAYPTSWDASHVSLFYWMNNLAQACAETFAGYPAVADRYLFCDENHKIFVDGMSELFTLSGSNSDGAYNEWRYLIEDRTNSESLTTFATVNGLSDCLVIAPDNYDYSGTPLKDSYTASEWTTAEELGLVCIPPAKYCRQGCNFYTEDPIDTAAPGYWSSTRNNADEKKYAFVLNNYEPPIYPTDSLAHEIGAPIRLVSSVH